MVAQAFQPAGLGDFPVAPSGTGKFRHQQTRMSALQNLPTKKNQAARVGGLSGTGGGRKLLQLRQRRLEGVKIGQILRRRRLFAVLHHALLINHERRARRRVAHAGQHREHDVVGFNHRFVQIAGEGDADFFLLRPGFLRKWTVHADADDVRRRSLGRR